MVTSKKNGFTPFYNEIAQMHARVYGTSPAFNFLSKTPVKQAVRIYREYLLGSYWAN